MSLLHGCRHNYVLSYSNVASWKGQESQCDILMSAGGWNVISIKQVVQKDYNHNLQSKSNSLDYSTVFYFDVDLPANKISNSFKDYLHWKFLLWTCVFCKLNIPSFVPKICRTIFGENIRCITFKYFCTKIFFELVNIFGTGCGTICCVVVWCHYCVAGPGLIWLVSRKFYLVTWRHCGQESAVQCGPQYKIFYFLISVRGPGSQIALLSLSGSVVWLSLSPAARLRRGCQDAVDTIVVASQDLGIIDISSVWVYSVKYSARWVENVFLPTLNYKYILHQH